MGYALQPEWLVELNRIDRRGFCSGFYFDDPQQTAPDFDFEMGTEAHRFIGKILTVDDDGHTLMEVRNKFRVGDPVEILSPRQSIRKTIIRYMRDDEGNPIQMAQPNTRVYPDLGLKTQPNDLIRKLTLVEPFNQH